MRVFNPYAPSNNQTPPACYRKHEQEKKRAYEHRIREVEHSSFTPLVFSATGGMGREATCFYKRLASMLAQKWDHPYCTTLWWLRCRLTFSLICSAIQALRGARSSRGQAAHPPTAIDLAITESHFLTEISLLFCIYNITNFPLFFFCCITCSACVRDYFYEGYIALRTRPRTRPPTSPPTETAKQALG